jgi:hypothetical protein
MLLEQRWQPDFRVSLLSTSLIMQSLETALGRFGALCLRGCVVVARPRRLFEIQTDRFRTFI